MTALASIIGLAVGNSANLENQYVQIDKTAAQEEFIEFLENSLKCSVNVSHANFIRCMDVQAYQSAYESFSSEALAIEHFGGRANQRIVFDSTFEFGKKFKYFALNAGNMGLPIWAPYCLIFDLCYFDESNSVILYRNSLDKTNSGEFYYFDSGGSVNMALLGIEIGNRSIAVSMTFLKHHYSVEKTIKDQWSSLVCEGKYSHNKTSYLELITYQECKLSNTDFHLRMLRSDISEIIQTLKDKMKSNVTLDGWEIKRDEFEELNSTVNKLSIKMELI